VKDPKRSKVATKLARGRPPRSLFKARLTMIAWAERADGVWKTRSGDSKTLMFESIQHLRSFVRAMSSISCQPDGTWAIQAKGFIDG
jgi:hypothetical protein